MFNFVIPTVTIPIDVNSLTTQLLYVYCICITQLEMHHEYLLHVTGCRVNDAVAAVCICVYIFLGNRSIEDSRHLAFNQCVKHHTVLLK